MLRLKRILPLVLLSVLLTMSGCTLPGLGGPGKDTISIGTLDTSESQILGHIVKYMIEHNMDAPVTMINNLGSSLVQHKAMESGDVNITATRYIGTDLAGALGMEPVQDPEEALKVVQHEFEERFDQTWFDSYGFANTYAFTVRKELAEREGFQTVSDLEASAEELKFGVDNSWLKRKGDGYEGFVQAYGFEFGHTYPMQLGLVYQAIASERMDVVLAYSTDGRIKAFDLHVLEDDLLFFPPYEASLVARNDLLDKYPGLEEILQKLAGKIDTEKMQELNYEADGNLKEPSIIAREFLEENNYFE